MDKTNRMHRIAAVITAGMIVDQSTSAHAAATASFTDLSANLITSSSNFPALVSTVAYIGGIGLGVTGIFKLKQHVDNPGQTPMKDGLIRLAAGGGLLALPYVTTAMSGSIGSGGSTTQASQFAAPTAAPVTG
jgi:hypothetical protein